MAHDSSPTIFAINLTTSMQSVLDVFGAVFDVTIRPFATGHGALEAAAEAVPVAVLCASRLPDGEGGLVLAEVRRRWSNLPTALLASIPLGFAPEALRRWGVSAVIHTRPGWLQELAALLERPVQPEFAAVWAAMIDREAQASSLERLILDPNLRQAELALRYLAITVAPERALRGLETAIEEDSQAFSRTDNARPQDALYRTALELAIDLGGVGFSVASSVAVAVAAPLDVRGRALRHLAEYFSFEAVLPVLQASLSDSSYIMRMDAGRALVEAAARSKKEAGQDVLTALVQARALPLEVRTAALDALFLASRWDRAVALARRLVAQNDPVADHARQHLMHIDALDVDSLTATVASEINDDKVRKEALRQAAQYLPRAQCHAMFQAAMQSSSLPVRALAFELSMSLEDAVVAGAEAQRAVLFGAMTAGPQAGSTVAQLASRDDVVTDVRVRAIRLLGGKKGSSEAARILERVLRSSDLELAHAAVWASVQLGPIGHALLRSVLSSGAQVEIRDAALVALDGHAVEPVVTSALVRASKDPDLTVRATAVHIAARRAGAQIEPLLKRLVQLGVAELQHAAIEGVASLGGGGFEALTVLVKETGLAMSARRLAWAFLQGEHSEDVGSVHGWLTREAPAVLEFSVEADPASSTQEEPTSSPSGPVQWDESGPARPAVPRAKVRPKVSHRSTTSLQTAPRSPSATKPRVPSDAATKSRDRSWAEQVDDTLPGAPADVVPTVPTAPVAEPPSPTVPVPPAAVSARAELPKFESARPAAARVSPKAPRMIDEARAMQAFTTAVQLGRDGYRGLRTLADSERVPVSVRIQALRHLAADFPDRDVAPVLERALSSSAPGLCAAALSSLMLRSDARRTPIETFIMTSSVEPSVRIRALRFLASRWPKREVKPILEQCLDGDEPQLQRVALESLFTSMRFVHPSAVEEGLINLLNEHEALEVKMSAAKALGAFGAGVGLKALQSYTGLLTAGDLRQVAQRAAERIQARIGR